jgi:hypothetical protein
MQYRDVLQVNCIYKEIQELTDLRISTYFKFLFVVILLEWCDETTIKTF